MEQRSRRSRNTVRRFDNSDDNADRARGAKRKSARNSGDADASDTDSTGPVRRRRARKKNGSRCVPESELENDVKNDERQVTQNGQGEMDSKPKASEIETGEPEPRENAGETSAEDYAAKEAERRERSRQARESRQLHEQVCRDAAAFMFTFFSTVVLPDTAQAARLSAPLATVSRFADALVGTRPSRSYDNVRNASDLFRKTSAHQRELESFAHQLRTIATAVSPAKRRIFDQQTAQPNPTLAMPDAFAYGEW